MEVSGKATGIVTGDDPWRIRSGSRQRVGFLL
jgi:hypothetical protein